MATRFIGAVSISHAANDWLTNTRQPRILHVFEQACNLIDEQGEVLSIVTPQIGNGPYNLVVEHEICFSDHLHIQSPISNNPPQLTVGPIRIDISKAKVWNSRPDWESLHSCRLDILRQLKAFHSEDLEFSKPPVSSLSIALINNDISSSVAQASQLAGLGVGLTPSGDDFMIGALYATWIIHPHDIASHLATTVAAAAAPLTTSLSAAWLRSAGKGEAGILWHKFLHALTSSNLDQVQSTMARIRSIGATSGADALEGFVKTFEQWVELTHPQPDSLLYSLSRRFC